MRVLVTGDRGYLGTVTKHALTDAGFDVSGCDLGWFDGSATAGPICDFRDLDMDDLKNVDVVVHLAAVCNDACGDISALATEDVNHTRSVRLANIARAAGVGSFLLASSCSVYGAAGDVTADENFVPVPLTAYGASKLSAERAVLELARPDFSPVALRFATLYGYSPSFRSDLMVNRMVSTACRDGRIHVSGTGAAIRPLLHVSDAAAAVRAVVEAGPSRSGPRLFNVGRTGENFRVADIAELVSRSFPRAAIVGAGLEDARSYSVDFRRFAAAYPKGTPTRSPADGVEDVAAALRRGDLRELETAAPGWGTTDRKDWLLNLIGGHHIDELFRPTGTASRLVGDS